VLASRPFLLRGEDFGFNARSATQYDRCGSQLRVFLEWFHAAVPTPFVAKLRKPTVGLKCQPSSYVRLEAYGFFGLSEGA
jgi:hypothetical protein